MALKYYTISHIIESRSLEFSMPSLRLAANLHWLFTELDFDDRFAAASAAGFTAVEFPTQWMGRATALHRLLGDHGLHQVLINTPAGDPGSPGDLGWASVPDAQSDFQRSFEQALDAAVTLGADVVHVRAGRVQEGQEPQHALDTVTERLAWAGDLARGSGVMPVLELQNQADMPGFAYRSMEDAEAIVNAVGSDRVQLLFDLYHAHRVHGDALYRFAELLPITAHVQLADPLARHEPGAGELDWQPILHRLAAQWDGWVGLEYAPNTSTSSALQWAEPYGITASTEPQ